MINELYGLAEALGQADIATQPTYPKYKLIPKITNKAPCVHILFDDGKIYQVESLASEQASEIRKYGTNQGTFPAMNLAPLYRLTDESEKKLISELMEEKTTEFDIDQIRHLCREQNWGGKFRKKYRLCMKEMPQEMTELLEKGGINFQVLGQLIQETRTFTDADTMHRALEKAAVAMLSEKREIAFALKILFYLGKPEKNGEEDYGTLSVVLDSRQLREKGMSVASSQFTEALNQKLMDAEAAMEKEAKSEAVKEELDAFGNQFTPLEEPMPSVKLAAGFDVTLRTMFRGQPCQTRYGKIENASYPISKKMRYDLQSALAWLSREEQKKVTWLNTDKNEALFAYMETSQHNQYNLVKFLKRQSAAEADTGEAVRFEDAVKAFIKELMETKKPGTELKSEHIQYFILRKIDKARTKVVYSYNTSPVEMEQRSEQWTLGCRNLPFLPFGRLSSLYPLEVADILNEIWRQDGKLSTDKFKPIPRYHGIQILFGEPSEVIHRDLYGLVKNTMNLAPYVGKKKLEMGDEKEQQLRFQTQRVLALMGLFLYQLNIRKEKYMQDFPYILGQLMKVSDTLHALYCKVVRDNDIPNTLVGSGMYNIGAEQPYKALALLGQRMNPYITWAKSYRAKEIQTSGEESWRAGWYLNLYEKFATKLYAVWGSQTRFNEEEKAQYFIGYLAEFPKTEKPKTSVDSAVKADGNQITQEMEEGIEGGHEDE